MFEILNIEYDFKLNFYENLKIKKSYKKYKKHS